MKQMDKTVIERPIKLIFNSAVLITLIFSPIIADPFNSPKFWALILCASLISGYTMNKKLSLDFKDAKFYNILRITLSSYLIFSLISSIQSYNPQISFLGENFRKNGLLTFIALSVFFIAATKYVRFDNLNLVFKRLVFTGAVVSAYSIIQITKNDFIAWSDPNQIISTLGNSNFAGSAMAIFAIVCFGQLLIKSVNLYYKLFNVILFIFIFYSIQKTNARQALFILAIGIFVILLIRIFTINKRYGQITLLAFFPVGLLSLLALLQIGPLQTLLYKGTVSIRGYYWRAGIEMFKTHPFFGVGIDNYGKFFKEYREVGYPLKYGFGITSSNAHNVFIQNFATGGIFVGVLYFTIQLLIFYRAIFLIKNSIGENRTKSSIIFAAWLAFQIQSLVSIDNVGLSIWGWVLGGALAGLSFNSNSTFTSGKKRSNSSINIEWRKVLPSFCLFLVSVILIVPLWIGERNIYLSLPVAAAVQKNDPRAEKLFDLYSSQAINAKFISNDYLNIIANSFIETRDNEKALDLLLTMNKADPRNLDTLSLLCALFENTGNYLESIKYRNEIAKYDPWNAQNYLGLAKLYKLTNDQQNMNVMVSKILSFAANDPIAEVAKKEFLQNTK
jgi:O-antigen ligase